MSRNKMSIYIYIYIYIYIKNEAFISLRVIFWFLAKLQRLKKLTKNCKKYKSEN